MLICSCAGLLSSSNSSFLISITRRQQVAQIQGKPIYVITEVALTPLSSRAEAESSITHTQSTLQKGTADDDRVDESDSEDDDGSTSAEGKDDVEDDDVVPAVSDIGSQAPRPVNHKRSSSVAEDVISRKGGYGRFAQKWFSSTGWTLGQRRNLGMSIPESESGTSKPPVEEKFDVSNTENAGDQKASDAVVLLPKLLRMTKTLLGSSRSFYFSYDYDITRSFASRRTTTSELPLYTEADPLFFWNHHLIQPFINAKQNSLVLPLMQGFIGQRSFEMDTSPPKPVIDLDGAAKSSMEMTDLSLDTTQDETIRPNEDSSSPTDRQRGEGSSTMRLCLLTLVSRRSIKRAGLRYLRRGVDEEGNTANGVETEQILSVPDWTSSSKIYSFVQIRGSIPIFFSQSPNSFKPVPQIQHSADMNHRACVKHFKDISERYGEIQVTSLVEKHGNEAIVGQAYEHHIDRMNESGEINGSLIGFDWFDFHAVCRGMKFENVSILMNSLGKKLDSFGNTVEVEGKQISKQSGVLRTNCMDCLDRTNVVQSAVGRRALELQLKCEGIDMSLQNDQTAQWFNTLWADNGDAISKQYASTAAMKGDFTRTRKRDYRGALTDMGLSISRFYNG